MLAAYSDYSAIPLVLGICAACWNRPGARAAALLIVLGYVPWLPRLVAHANLVLDPAHVTFRLGPVLQALGIAAPSGDVQVALQWGALAGAIVACAAIWGAWRSWGRSADMAGAAVVLVHGFSAGSFVWDPTFTALRQAGTYTSRNLKSCWKTCTMSIS